MEKGITFYLLTLLLLMASSAMTQTNITTDQLALLSLKSKIIFDPSHFLDENWSPTVSVCHWVGVTCGSRHQRVNSLNLSNMDLIGKISREFGTSHFLCLLTWEVTISREICLKKWHAFIGLSFLEGQIPKAIGTLVNLRVLNLGGNKLIGFMRTSLSNASRLETLEISFNSLQGNIPEGIGNLHNMNWLAIHFNQLTGSIPFTIFNISRIEVLSFTGNSLSGSLPNGICNGLPMLKGVYLTGEIPKEISNLIELERLSLSFNSFSGPLDMKIFNISGLRVIALSNNNLSGSLPQNMDTLLSFLTSLSNCRNLTYLDISLNLLNDMLPASTGNLSTSLRTFFAISCKIQGRIPDEVGNLSSLLDLRLSGNNLVGSIPTTIGSLPNCLWNITTLREIHLGSNKLSSNIPPRLGNLHDLVVLDLSSNNMVGSLPSEIGNLKAVTKMDLSMNQFSNRIPREIGGLQNLAHPSLRHNKLQGAIPDSMSNMIGLEFLDLSNNNISGTIPMLLEKLQYLKYFNVSVNKFHGEIPSGGPFKNLSSQFFIHKEALRGSSRFSVPPCPTSSKHKSNRKKLLLLFLLLAIAVVFFCITFVLLWIRYRSGKSAPEQAVSLSTIARERISYYELLQATDDLSESNLIGSGSFGSVYKGILKSGIVVAVKVFNLQLDVAFKSFDTECEVLCSLRHRNLVKVITSCSNLDFKALVLEYMPNESLDKYLYSHNYFLNIRQRLSIMLDVACVLEYLHHRCTLPVIHCHLKPRNVLLDEDMVAHQSNFGISKLLGEDESDLYTKTLATFGYIAPGAIWIGWVGLNKIGCL
ncbi:hypothetical protein P3L10_014250 [Capsicum annuum]